MTVLPFFAIRHGETDWNRSGYFQGHSEVGINETGRAQATDCAVKLQHAIGTPDLQSFDLNIIASPLSRARETATIVANALGISEATIKFDPRLREMSFGKWEGMTTHEVKDKFYEERKLRKVDRWNFAPPQGQSPAMLAAAMTEFLNDESSGTNRLIVTHSGNIKTLFHLLAGASEDEALATNVPHDALYCYDGSTFRRIL